MTEQNAGSGPCVRAAAMLEQRPELRELVRVARAWSEGEIHVSHLCTTALLFDEAARFLPMPPEIKRTAEQWAKQSRRLEPGMTKVADPLPEDQFLQWVRSELRAYEAVALPALL